MRQGARRTPRTNQIRPIATRTSAIAAITAVVRFDRIDGVADRERHLARLVAERVEAEREREEDDDEEQEFQHAPPTFPRRALTARRSAPAPRDRRPRARASARLRPVRRRRLDRLGQRVPFGERRSSGRRPRARRGCAPRSPPDRCRRSDAPAALRRGRARSAAGGRSSPVFSGMGVAERDGLHRPLELGAKRGDRRKAGFGLRRERIDRFRRRHRGSSAPRARSRMADPSRAPPQAHRRRRPERARRRFRFCRLVSSSFASMAAMRSSLRQRVDVRRQAHRAAGGACASSDLQRRGVGRRDALQRRDLLRKLGDARLEIWRGAGRASALQRRERGPARPSAPQRRRRRPAGGSQARRPISAAPRPARFSGAMPSPACLNSATSLFERGDLGGDPRLRRVLRRGEDSRRAPAAMTTIAAIAPPAKPASRNGTNDRSRSPARGCAEAHRVRCFAVPGSALRVAKADGITGSAGGSLPALAGQRTPSPARGFGGSLAFAASAVLADDAAVAADAASDVAPASPGFRPTSAAGRSMVSGFRGAFCGETRSSWLVGSFAKSVSVRTAPNGSARRSSRASAISSLPSCHHRPEQSLNRAPPAARQRGYTARRAASSASIMAKRAS